VWVKGAFIDRQPQIASEVKLQVQLMQKVGRKLVTS
jgi:hypothetical protein